MALLTVMVCLKKAEERKMKRWLDKEGFNTDDLKDSVEENVEQ